MAAPRQLLTLLAVLALTERGPRRGFNPLGRITDAAVGVLPINTVIEEMDIDALLERVDIQSLLDRIDLDEILARVDMDQLLAGIDLDELLQRVDLDEVLDRVDVNQLLDRVDPDRLLDRVDPDRLLDRVDPDRLLDRVDPDRLLDRVDPNRLLDRVDTDALIARTDLNAAMDQIDLDRIMDRIDVERVVDRAGVPDLVRESTGHMAGSMLDLARRQVVALDQIIMRLTARVFRFPPGTPLGPPELAAGSRTGGMVDEDGKGVITGHYTGPLARLLAFVLDSFLVVGTFTLFSTGVLYVLQDMLGRAGSTFSSQTPIGFLMFATWAFWYRTGTVAIAGQTVGMGVLGIRVVDRRGSPVKFRQSVIRTLVLPFSLLLMGLGTVGVFIGRKRRTLHDLVAGTVVVYDWGDRPAEMPAPLTRWLAEHQDD